MKIDANKKIDVQLQMTKIVREKLNTLENISHYEILKGISDEQMQNFSMEKIAKRLEKLIQGKLFMKEEKTSQDLTKTTQNLTKTAKSLIEKNKKLRLKLKNYKRAWS